MVVGPSFLSPEVAPVLHSVAQSRNSPVHCVRDINELNLSPVAADDPDPENFAIARLSLDVLHQNGHIRSPSSAALEAARQASLPCRIQRIQLDNKLAVYLDVAHNPAGLKRLFARWVSPYCIYQPSLFLRFEQRLGRVRSC